MSYIQRRAESTTKTQHKNKLSYGITSLVRYSSSHLLVLLCTTDKTGGGQATVGERRRASDVHSKYSSSTCSSRLHTHFSNYMISINSRIAVYNQHERRRASDGGRAMYSYRNTAYVPGAAFDVVFVGVVFRFFYHFRSVWE